MDRILVLFGSHGKFGSHFSNFWDRILVLLGSHFSTFWDGILVLLGLHFSTFWDRILVLLGCGLQFLGIADRIIVPPLDYGVKEIILICIFSPQWPV